LNFGAVVDDTAGDGSEGRELIGSGFGMGAGEEGEEGGFADGGEANEAAE
jgi:hypothetical protein